MTCYLNGEFMPHSEARIEPWDHGFMLGVAVAELVRTFAGKTVLLSRHLARMEAGLQQLGLSQNTLSEQGHDLRAIIDELLSKNKASISAGSEFTISITVTPGLAEYAMPANVIATDRASVFIYTRELKPSQWSQLYQAGYRLTTVQTIEAPPQMLPKVLKSRSRMHYYIAEREANAQAAGTRALLLDGAGWVAEGTTAAIVAVIGDVLVAPPQTNVLTSVSFGFLKELAGQLKVPVREQNLTPQELSQAEEILWLSTPMCVAPVTELDGRKIGTGQPGPVFESLLSAWSAAVGTNLHV